METWVYDGERAPPPCSRAATPARYPTDLPDPIRFPSESISTSDDGVTGKKRPVPGPDPELDRDRGAAGDHPEPCEIVPVIVRKLRHACENFLREHHAREHDGDLRDDREIVDPFRPACCELDEPAGFCDGDCVPDRPVGTRAAAGQGRCLRVFGEGFMGCASVFLYSSGWLIRNRLMKKNPGPLFIGRCCACVNEQGELGWFNGFEVERKGKRMRGWKLGVGNIPAKNSSIASLCRSSG